MDISLATIEDFKSLFSGNMTAYGVHEIDPNEVPDSNGKTRGRNYTNLAPVTIDLYREHLGGKKGLGVVPVTREGTCSFAAIDVDVYDNEHRTVLKVLNDYSFPLVPFRSKSGGLHLYLFLKTQEDAKEIIEILKHFRRALMLDEKTEVFPKQRTLRPDEAGNWINIPYFNYDNTKQFAMDKNGDKLGIIHGIDLCKEKRTNVEELKKFIEDLPFSDGPPCLQAIYMRGTTSHRNNYLMSMATYHKAKVGDNFEFAVAEINNKLDEPIELERLMKTVISSQKKRNYSYLCNEEPICKICDKTECKKRKYGIGGAEISELTFEDFTQFNTDPPYYEWKVNGKILRFFKESDIINQQEFRNLCFRTIHILPMKMKDETWTKILNTALGNVIVKEVSIEDDVSAGSMFMEYLAEYLTKRAPAANKEQIRNERPYYDAEKDSYVFKPSSLHVFLTVVKSFRAYSVTEVRSKLTSLGAYSAKYYISERYNRERVWIIPRKSLGVFVSDVVDVAEVDFMEEMKGEAF